jgi:hypothetical protein
MIAMGATLRDARERAGVDVAVIASTLKLSSRFITGVEDGAIMVRSHGHNGRLSHWLWIVRVTETEAFFREYEYAFQVPYFEWRHGDLERQLKAILKPIHGLRRRRARDAAKAVQAQAQVCLEELAAARDYPALDAVWDVVRAEVSPKYQEVLLLAATNRTYSGWLDVVRVAGLIDREKIRKWLEAEHGVRWSDSFNLAIRLSRTLASERQASTVNTPASEDSADS